VSDYYITPVDEVRKFLDFIKGEDPSVITGHVLDPCAGGSPGHAMSYPAALSEIFPRLLIDTIDIRQDSLADIKGDYLQAECGDKYRTIITNPPFNGSMQIIEKALSDVMDGGHVVMLQRLNFMGSKQRKPFWSENMPKYTVVHHKRMSFTENGGTDSIEYAHYVWQKGWRRRYGYLYII
jgi:hypothetical protein